MGTIVRRGDSFRAIIRRKGFPVKTRTFSRHALARKWIYDVERDCDERKGSSDLVSDLLTKYANSTTGHRKLGRTMVSGYLKLARMFEGVTVKELTSPKLVEWATGRTVSRATISQELVMISSALRTAEAAWGVTVAWDELRKARHALRRMGVSGRSRERERRPTAEEIVAVKKAVRSTLPMDDIIDFAIDTAMRLGEITRVRHDDYDPVKKTLLIRDRKHPTEKKDQRIPLFETAVVIMERQPEREDGRIFPFNGDSVSAAFQRAVKRAGVKDLRFHDLRHEGVSRLFERGYAIHHVALVSGHRSWDQLRRYTNLKPESLHRKDPAEAG